MLSKREISFLKSLHQKKYRQEHRLFIAEGSKVVEELLRSGLPVRQVFVTGEAEYSHPAWLKEIMPPTEVVHITSKELRQISALTTPHEMLAVAAIPDRKFEPDLAKEKLILALEDVADPGNLGTIVRIADWFGIGHILCSEKTVDAYNPKVVQASMGSLFRVKVYYTDLSAVLAENRDANGAPVYGTVLEGEDIYKAELTSNGFILLGNESVGLSKEIGQFITQAITIPKGGTRREKSSSPDSLNVAISAAIVCSEFRRRTL